MQEEIYSNNIGYDGIVFGDFLLRAHKFLISVLSSRSLVVWLAIH